MKRSIILKLLCIILLSFVFEAVSASEETISDAVKKFAENRKPTRVAVLDFVSAGDKKTRYDAFIADTIISELSKYKLTLLERKRLELLLNEHKLSQSGIVDSEKAMKLGSLLPVDVVASGSYTEFEGKLVINGRFIHVGTGEILYAFTASMAIEPSKAPASPDAETGCEKQKEVIKKALSDLGNESAINKAVETAINIPFMTECGNVHYRVMETFVKFKIYPAKYKSFLITTLNSIDNPSGDKRANEIIRLFALDGAIDNEEWTASLAIIQKMRATHWLNEPLGYMLREDGVDLEIVKKRIDEVMALAFDKKIGRPVPATQEYILFEVISALRYSHNFVIDKCYVFKKYMNIIPDNDKYNKESSNQLKYMYFNANKRADQKEVLSILISFFKSRNSDVLAEECAYLVQSIEGKTKDAWQPDKNKMKDYAEDLPIINKSLEELYCRSVGTARKRGERYTIEERELHILRNKMKCGQAPAIKDLEADMRSGDWDKKLKAIEMLSKIGEAAKEAEDTVIKYLGQQGFGRQGEELRSLCAKTLGNIKTINPKGIEILIESFTERYNRVSGDAEEAIKGIGLPAMPYLVKGLGHNDHKVRQLCAKALGNLGRNAKEALPELKRLSEKDSDYYVKKEAQEAAQMISNDY